jgi:hypothetical protein
LASEIIDVINFDEEDMWNFPVLDSCDNNTHLGETRVNLWNDIDKIVQLSTNDDISPMPETATVVWKGVEEPSSEVTSGPMDLIQDVLNECAAAPGQLPGQLAGFFHSDMMMMMDHNLSLHDPTVRDMVARRWYPGGQGQCRLPFRYEDQYYPPSAMYQNFFPMVDPFSAYNPFRNDMPYRQNRLFSNGYASVNSMSDHEDLPPLPNWVRTVPRSGRNNNNNNGQNFPDVGFLSSMNEL